MKRLSKLLALCLSLLLLAGCGAPAAQPSDDSTPLQKAPNASGLGASLESTSAECPLPTEDPLTYVTVTGADPALRIPLSAPSSYSPEQVLAGIALENVSSPIYTSGEPGLIQPDLLEAQGANGSFQVYARDGFKKGDVYQLVLQDDALSFSDHDPCVRTFNLTTDREDTFTAKLKPEVRLLSANRLSTSDAEAIKELDGLLGCSSDGLLKGDKPTGTFTSASEVYHPGEIVAVYEGKAPSKRSLTDSSAGVAYVKIKEVTPRNDGSRDYAYESAEYTDVVFTPDVIPMAADPAFQKGQGQLTLDAADLIFTSDGPYADLGLDENTNVEAGDYLAFYQGSMTEGQVTAYAEITDAAFFTQDDRDRVTLTYREASLDDLLTSADIYRERPLTEEQILSAYDEEEVRLGIIADMDRQGLLTASTYELTQSVLDTEEVKEAFGDTDLENLNFYFGQDESVFLSGADYAADAQNGGPSLAAKVDVKGDPDVTISPNIVHFAGKTGYGSGVRLEAYAKYYITIRPDNTQSKSMMKITLVFYFETELTLGLSVDATSIWKYKWIFPYLYDISVTGKFGAGFYIGAGFTTVATLVKYEAEKTDEEQLAGLKWPEDLDNTKGTYRIQKLAEYVRDSGKSYKKIFPDQDTGGGDLAKKYASFAYAANNKDWVDIFDKNIFDFNGFVEPFHLVAFRLKADAVVSTELHVAVGAAINYEISGIDTCSFLLIHEDTNAKHMDNTDQSLFRADLYLFGVLGIRAGIRLKPAVGLLDARLDCIGFEIEGGFYGRLWGMLYGGIEITDVGLSTADSHGYWSGAFLADCGAYYSVTFVAELADGQISKKIPVDSGEYPIFQLGTPDFTTDFGYDDASFAAEFQKNQLTSLMPQNLFNMQSMDLKSGKVTTVNKGDRNLLDLYDISFSDDAFSYQYENGKHYLQLDYDKRDSKGEGDLTMTLTWKGNGFEFNTDTIRRTISIHWICDKTSLQFLNKDGSLFHVITQAAGTPIKESSYPGTPELHGWSFIGWYVSGQPRTPTDLPTIMPERSTVYESLWKRIPAPVSVEYQVSVLNNGHGVYYYDTKALDVLPDTFYPEDSVENILSYLQKNNLLRTEDSYYPDGSNPFAHYVLNQKDSILSCDAVAEDGSTRFVLALVPETLTLRFNLGDSVDTAKVDYGSPVPFPEARREGFTLIGWTNKAGESVSSSNTTAYGDETYTAVWAENATTLTLLAQVKEKIGFQYMWRTVRSETFEVDGSPMNLADLIARIAPEGYVFDPDSCGYEERDVLTPKPNQDNRVTLRFKALG